MEAFRKVTASFIFPFVYAGIGFIMGIIATNDFFVEIGRCQQGDSLCTIANVLCGMFLVVIVIYFITSVYVGVLKLFSVGKIKIITEDNVKITLYEESSIGWLTALGLRIENPNQYEIYDCIGTLEKLETGSLNNGRLVFKNLHLLNEKQTSNKLRWAKSALNDVECKTNLPGKSKESILLVSNFIEWITVTRDGGNTNTQNEGIFFSFSLCANEPKNKITPGLFKLRIRINAKVKDKHDIVEYFNGYIFSYLKINKESAEWDMRWVKNPEKDNVIMDTLRARRK